MELLWLWGSRSLKSLNIVASYPTFDRASLSRLMGRAGVLRDSFEDSLANDDSTPAGELAAALRFFDLGANSLRWSCWMMPVLLPPASTPLDVDAVVGKARVVNRGATGFVVTDVLRRTATVAVCALCATGLLGRLIPRRVEAASMSALLCSKAVRCSFVYSATGVCFLSCVVSFRCLCLPRCSV